MTQSPAPPVVLMVTGGREYRDRAFIHAAMDTVRERHGGDVLIHGGARGVDTLAGEWARERGLETRVFEPDYRERRAPLRRNIRMLEQRPDHVVVFPGGSGTAFTKRHAVQRGLNVLLATSL